MSDILFLGIDPGISGAMVLVDQYGKYIDHTRGDRTDKDQSNWLKKVASDILLAYIEKVHSYPGQGVVSTFKFGMSFGFLKGILAYSDISYEFVTPIKWQTVMQCRTGGDKNITRGKAQQMFPNIKVIHAFADALLIAEYSRRIAIERKLF